MQDIRVQSLGWEDPLEIKQWLHTPVFLPGECHGQRRLAGYSPRVTKSWTQLSDGYEHNICITVSSVNNDWC